MKRIISVCLGTLIIGILAAGPVLAAGYSYDITLTESSGNPYTQTPFIATVNNTGLVSQGYLSSTGLDGIVKDGGTSLPTLVTNDKVLFVDNLNANQSKTVQYTTGNDPVFSMPIIVGDGGSIDTLYNISLEPGSGDFEIDFPGFIDTSYAPDKYICRHDGENTIQVTNDEEITLTVYDGSTYTDVITGIPSGHYSTVSLVRSGGTVTLTIGAYSCAVSGIGTIPDNNVDWIWNENNAMPYIDSITIDETPSTMIQHNDASPAGGAPFGDNYWYGAQFQASSTYTVTSVGLYLSSYGGKTGDVTVSIKSSLTGADLCFGAISGVGIPVTATDYVWANANMGAGAILTDTNMYYICIRNTGGSSTFSYLLGTSGATSNEFFSNDSGANWGNDGGSVAYRVYASSGMNEVLKYQPNEIITGTVLPDRDFTENGVITWGSNPSGVTITVGGLTPTAPTVYGAGNYGAFNNGGAGTINLQNPLAPNQLYTELDASKVPFGSTINELLNEGGVPQALWWFPFIFVGAVIIGMLVYDATQRTGGQGSLLTMCITIEILLVLFGVMGVTGVSGMIPLWSALLFPIPAAALILSRRHVGWG